VIGSLFELFFGLLLNYRLNLNIETMDVNKRIKKEWSSPQLIVLTRNHAEEAVLLACKGSGDWGGADPADVECSNQSCAGCDVQGDS